MKNRKIEIAIISIYIIIMIVGTLLSNIILNKTDSQIAQLISLTITQLISTLSVNYIIKKHYTWQSIGFGKLNKKALIWLIPYMFIVMSMITTLINEICNNMHEVNILLVLTILINLIGTIAAGFSEEVIFRGVLLNNFRKDTSIVVAMIVSSVAFLSIHITTVFSGLSLLQAVCRVLYTSLLGFSFVSLAIKINNLWPLIIFHILWNYVLIISSQFGIEVSKCSLFFNPINLVIGIILWTVIIIEEIKKKKV